MRKKLSLELRRELLTRTAEDYASARKGIKSQIVDQLVAEQATVANMPLPC